MVKNKMNLPLAVDETNIKGSIAVFTTAEDKEILPYAVGYIPQSLILKSTTYRKLLMGNAIANPGQTLQYNPETIISDNITNLPFIYTVKQGTDNHYVNLYNSGTDYIQIPWANNNNNLGILAAYNAQYYVSNDYFTDLKVDNIGLGFSGYETISQQEGWQGNASIGNIAPVQPIINFSVNADISLTDGEIKLIFLYNLASKIGTHTYTINQNIFNEMWTNGIIFIDGGDYEYGGITYKRKLFLFITSAWINLANAPAGKYPGYGAVIGENIRRTQFNYLSSYATKFQINYQNTILNQLIMSQNMININEEFPSQYGYFYSTSETGPCVFRCAIQSWINYIVSGGMTWEDIIIMICTARPLYYIKNEQQNWGYYVAEFDNNYQITGRLISFEDAKVWQKNINADTNKFNPINYPERELTLKNQKILNFINRFIDGRAGSINSFNSTTMIGE